MTLGCIQPGASFPYLTYRLEVLIARSVVKLREFSVVT